MMEHVNFKKRWCTNRVKKIRLLLHKDVEVNSLFGNNTLKHYNEGSSFNHVKHFFDPPPVFPRS